MVSLREALSAAGATFGFPWCLGVLAVKILRI
jgi:hypothetical protein